jgi:hypothetical protein
MEVQKRVLPQPSLPMPQDPRHCRTGGTTVKPRWTKIDPDNLPEDQTGFALVYYGDREFWDADGETPALHPDRDLIERTDLAFWDDGALCEQGTGHDVFEEWNSKGTPTHFAPIELSAPATDQKMTPHPLAPNY